MSTLILVTCDAGAGYLKREKRADRVQALTHRLVTGPVPVEGPPETFFARQRALFEADGLFHELQWFEVENPDENKPKFPWIWSQLPEVCQQHDRIELWIDPDPNAQLVMVQLLDWLGTLPDIVARLWLKLSDSPLGSRHPGDWVLPPRHVEAADLSLAHRAWSAFGTSTPEAWSELRGDPDLDRLPGLLYTIEHTLRELPDATGLGATARRILTLIEKQSRWIAAEKQSREVPDHVLSDRDCSLRRLIIRMIQSGERVPLCHSEIEGLICDLAAAPMPALSGVTESHAQSDVFRDPERYRLFQESPIHLTEFGRFLTDGVEDWSNHNPVHRWLGGTRLTNDNLWRWDINSRRPVAP